MEPYTLKESNNQTELIVDMDITVEFKESFQKTSPKALGIVKIWLKIDVVN
jgi:hypothetical protein